MGRRTKRSRARSYDSIRLPWQHVKPSGFILFLVSRFSPTMSQKRKLSSGKKTAKKQKLAQEIVERPDISPLEEELKSSLLFALKNINSPGPANSHRSQKVEMLNLLSTCLRNLPRDNGTVVKNVIRIMKRWRLQLTDMDMESSILDDMIDVSVCCAPCFQMTVTN